mgnify:CR=1 FL=1
MTTDCSHGLNVWQLTRQVHRELNHILSRELEQATGLGLRQYEVLFYLHNADNESLRLADLGESLLLKPPAATRFFDRMEQSGLIRRERGPDDRRVVRIGPTTEGTRRFEAAQTVYNTEVNRRFSHNLTAAERRVLNTALDKVLGALRERDS